MNPDEKVWLVDEEIQRTDPYIAILVREKELSEKPLKKAYKICHSTGEAIAYASELKKKYGVKQVRLFYPNDISIIVKQ